MGGNNYGLHVFPLIRVTILVVSTDSEPPENIVFREYRSERTRDHLSDALDVMEQVGADGFVRYEASAGIATLSVPGANDHIIYISSPER